MAKKNGAVAIEDKLSYLTTGGGKHIVLSVKERIVLGGLLPSQSDITTLRIVQEVREQLTFSPDEYDRYEIKQEGQQLRWNDRVEQPKDITVSKAAIGIIIAALKSLNENKKLTLDHLSLYEIFVEGPEE